MGSPDDFLYEYAVVRYVPRVDREEFINIGLVMMCKRRKWMRGEIKLDSERILAFDPAANLDFLKRYAAVFTRSDVPQADMPVEERYRWLTAVKSAVLQTSPSHPGIVCMETAKDTMPYEEVLDAEFERLFRHLVL